MPRQTEHLPQHIEAYWAEDERRFNEALDPSYIHIRQSGDFPPQTGDYTASRATQPLLPVAVYVENLIDTGFVLTVEQSDDNGDADPYAAINMRHESATVASVAIAGKGVVLLVIESAELTKPFFRLVATPASLADNVGNPHARATLTHWRGEMELVNGSRPA